MHTFGRSRCSWIGWAENIKHLDCSQEAKWQAKLLIRYRHGDKCLQIEFTLDLVFPVEHCGWNKFKATFICKNTGVPVVIYLGVKTGGTSLCV